MFVKMKRKVLGYLVTELFTYNERDQCWDPIGSIDRYGMQKIIEVIARGRLDPKAKIASRKYFVDRTNDKRKTL